MTSKNDADFYYPNKPVLITPNSQTPKHRIYLSNLDDQRFLRFSIKYLYVFKKNVEVENLKKSLSEILVEYYPLAGRLRESREDTEKLELDCNGEGALFVEAFEGICVDEFVLESSKPNLSWRKFLYRLENVRFVDVPPLIIQVTHLRCGGMILCTAISHSLCDGIGTAQFLHAWAHATTKPNSTLTISPFHNRNMLKPRIPPQITSSHPEFNHDKSHIPKPLPILLTEFQKCQNLVPISVTFTSTQILQLKKQCIPSLKCTSFEVLAVHVWKCWAIALDLPDSLEIKLLFSVNVREKMKPELPKGFYGNGFVLACAEILVEKLVRFNGYYGVKLVKEAKESVNDEKVKSVIDLLEDRNKMQDLSSSLVISQWAKLGLENLDFGEGRAVHMGPISSEIYCIFLPVIGDLNAFTVLMSVPEKVGGKFEQFLKAF